MDGWKRPGKPPKRSRRAKSLKVHYKKLKEASLLENEENYEDKSCETPQVADRNHFPLGDLQNFESPNEIDTVLKTDDSMEYAFISKEEYDSIMEHEIECEVSQEEVFSHLEGNRIVDLQYVLEWSMKLQLDHSKICTTGLMKIVGEKRSGLGLTSSVKFTCNMCNYTVNKLTERPSIGSKINIGAVWGTLTTGSTYSHLTELLACMDIPTMSYKKFRGIENNLSVGWESELYTSLENAGREEYSLATQKGQIDKDGNVWTTVYVDGGWSKRSYGHNYNAASGVGVIIGQLTNKILYVGVRNKYCCICARAAKKQQVPLQHNCYRNWDGSSPAMESDIITEGFRQSITMHKLKYLNIIADGDSSVYKKITEQIEYGRQVSKIECKNHVIKNYGKALYNMKKDTKIHVQGRNLLTINKIKELQTIAQMAMYNHKDGDIEMFKMDLENGPNHVFGNHKYCSDVYCDQQENYTNNQIPFLEDTGIFYHIKAALDRVIANEGSLIKNETSNRAELFMSQICKFNAGKRLNLIQRGSFETRAYLAALRYNEGIGWHRKAWQSVTEISPGKSLEKFLNQAETKAITRKKREGYEQGTSKPRKAAKMQPIQTDYGVRVAAPLLNEEQFQSEVERRLKNLKVSQEDILVIEKSTIGQWSNPRYKSERQDRLTASVFGEVCKRRATTHCNNLVKKILYSSNFATTAMQYGLAKESVALERFKKERKTTNVRNCGIFIDVDSGFLAASPDAIIGENGLIEIKCLHSVHKSGKTLEEAVIDMKNICLEEREGKIRLKRQHNYYYQIQGQLNICQKDICFFIVYISDEQPLFVEVISKDKAFWNEKMLPKLKSFYMDYIMPELIYRNIPKGLKAINETTFIPENT